MTTPKKGTLSRVFSAAVLLSTLVVAMVATASPAAAIEPAAFRSIAAGDDHQCFLSGGEVYCSGKNDFGQTGRDTERADVLVPTKVPGLSGVTAITAGENHTCALMSDSTARCWGKNDKTQLGNNTTTNSATPVPAGGLTGIKYLNAGDRHTCAVLNNGTIQCWGDNEYGQLGNGFNQGIAGNPVQVVGIANAVTVSGGQTHTCAVVDTGAAKCWGRNNVAQLGVGGGLSDKLTSTFVTGLSNVSSIAAGWNHTCAVRNDGAVFCWGDDESGQIGKGSVTGNKYNSPQRVAGVTGATQVAVGFRYSCALTNFGETICWGDNTGGQIGNGQSGNNAEVGGTDLNSPVPFQSLNTGATAISTGDQHTCALTDVGTYCWGDNNDGQLGTGNRADTTRPTGIAVAGTPAPGDPAPAPARTLEEIIAQPAFNVADADTLRLYNAFFLREPDVGGANYWLGFTRSGSDLSVLALQFAVSTEFQNTYGTLNNAQYVEQIYRNVLGRDFDQEGYEYWLGLLNDGSLDRGGVVRWIAANDEFKNENLYGGK